MGWKQAVISVRVSNLLPDLHFLVRWFLPACWVQELSALGAGCTERQGSVQVTVDGAYMWVRS